MYYLLEQAFDTPPTYQLETRASDVQPSLRWVEGRPFRRPPAQLLHLAVRSDPGASLPDFFQAEIPLFSADLLQEFLDGGVRNIDAFPVILEDSGTAEVWDHFYAVNVIGVIGCADMAVSDYTDLAGTQRLSVGFRTLVVAPSRCHGELCFRLHENLTMLVVHEKIATRPSMNRFQGVRFRMLEVSV